MDEDWWKTLLKLGSAPACWITAGNGSTGDVEYDWGRRLCKNEIPDLETEISWKAREWVELRVVASAQEIHREVHDGWYWMGAAEVGLECKLTLKSVL